MAARDEVKESLSRFICRACDADALNEQSIEALRLFLEHYGQPQERQRRVDKYLQEQEAAEIPQEPQGEPFPYEWTVSGKRAARYLGFDFKYGVAKLKRLANEGVIEKPVRHGSKEDYYFAQSIRRYAESLKSSGHRAA